MPGSLRTTLHSRAVMQPNITGVIPRAKLGPSWVSDRDKPIYHVSAKSGWLNVSLRAGIVSALVPGTAPSCKTHPDAPVTSSRTPTAPSTSMAATICASLTPRRCCERTEHCTTDASVQPFCTRAGFTSTSRTAATGRGACAGDTPPARISCGGSASRWLCGPRRVRDATTDALHL